VVRRARGLTDSPVHRLNRAVAVGEADGARAGLAALEPLDPELPRYTAVAAHLHEKDGDLSRAAELYAEAARRATNVPERDHLTRVEKPPMTAFVSGTGPSVTVPSVPTMVAC
jgi:predicted RNA polymerase sigma factor